MQPVVWIIALLCLGLIGATGYHQGPVRAGFSFLGLSFGALMAGPLSPLTKRLLPVFGLEHPIWQIFVPQAIGFVLVLIIFKIAGQVLHQRIALHFKYKVDELHLVAWQRMYSRLGACVGLLNGSVYFILLMIPVYVCGYFTAEAASGDGDPPVAQFLTRTRADLQRLRFDHVVAAYDPTPAQVYQAADMASLVLHNPLLESRLTHYPPLLQLGERAEFKEMANDVALQQLIQSQAGVAEILKYPRVQGIVTNAALTREIMGMIGPHLDDLQQFLNTGQSPIFDAEAVVGVWAIDPAATIAQMRAQMRRQGVTPVKLGAMEADVKPVIAGLSLTALPDHQCILKKQSANGPANGIVATGTWKKQGANYQVVLPGFHPESCEITIQDGNKLLLPRDISPGRYVLVFDKEM